MSKTKTFPFHCLAFIWSIRYSTTWPTSSRRMEKRGNLFSTSFSDKASWLCMRCRFFGRWWRLRRQNSNLSHISHTSVTRVSVWTTLSRRDVRWKNCKHFPSSFQWIHLWCNRILGQSPLHRHTALRPTSMLSPTLHPRLIWQEKRWTTRISTRPCTLRV